MCLYVYVYVDRKQQNINNWMIDECPRTSKSTRLRTAHVDISVHCMYVISDVSFGMLRLGSAYAGGFHPILLGDAARARTYCTRMQEHCGTHCGSNCQQPPADTSGLVRRVAGPGQVSQFLLRWSTGAFLSMEPSNGSKCKFNVTRAIKQAALSPSNTNTAMNPFFNPKLLQKLEGPTDYP